MATAGYENVALSGDPLANPQAFAYRSLIDAIGKRVQALHDNDPVLVGGDVLVRLEPDATGFANLSVVGEWTDTGVNISSIEATVISGMHASRSLSGQPVRIPGETDV